jgi:hypothetical protein
MQLGSPQREPLLDLLELLPAELDLRYRNGLSEFEPALTGANAAALAGGENFSRGHPNTNLDREHNVGGFAKPSAAMPLRRYSCSPICCVRYLS